MLSTMIGTIQIASHYGFEKQSEQLVEEMAELIVAIKHYKREDKKDFENLLKELADVEFMLDQVKFLLKCDYQVKEIKKQNIDKMLKTIAEEKEERKEVENG